VVEAVAIEVEVRRGRWSADAARALWLAAAAACMAGAAWVAWLTPARGLGVGLGLAGGLLAAGGGVLLRAVRQPLPGTVLALAGLALADRLPGLARLAAGLSVREEDAGGSGAALRDRVDRGHRLLAWFLAGVALGLTGALIVLALSGRPAAWALCVVAALAAGLRARRHRFVSQVVALAVPGLAGPIVVAAALPLSRPGLGAAAGPG